MASVIVRRHEAVLEILMNRPDVLNAFDAPVRTLRMDFAFVN